MNAFTLPGTDGIFIQGKLYSKKKLCLDWFQMSNDGFYDLYGFNFNPHEYPGLYDWGRKTLYGEWGSRMTEYIERSAAMESILGLTIADPAVAQYADAVYYNLQRLPAADVVEVRHGRWLTTD